LDYAASAPLRPEALAAWVEADAPGNPASVHSAGRASRATLETARERLAAAFGAEPAEVLFTSGGTEADNLALGGLYHARQTDAARPYVLVSAIEHPAVGEAAALLADRHGAEVTVLGVGRDGIVGVEGVAEAIERYGDGIALISLMAANNETGAVQPVAAVTRLAAARGIPVHSDWVHAAGAAGLDFRGSGLAAASLSAHKLGGPVGIGALLARRDAPLAAIMGGGGQERRVRSGTLDARGAAAFAAAAEVTRARAVAEAERLEALLRPLDALVAAADGAAVAGADGGLAAGADGAAADGPLADGALAAGADGAAADGALAAVADGALVGRTPSRHSAGLRLVTVPGAAAEMLVYLLDRAGVAVSAGAACSAGVTGPSAVLTAMGLGDEAASAIRVSVGWGSTAADIDRLVAVLPGVAATARAAAAAGRAAKGAAATGPLAGLAAP
jgi:cysteine desulfurase